MKKTLLTLAACALGFSAYAEDSVVINFENANSDNVVGTYVAEVLPEGDNYGSAEHWQPLESITLQGYTFSFSSEEKNQPALYGSTTASKKTEKTVRIYTGTTMTIAAPEGVTVTKIEFLGSGSKVSKKTTCSTGSLAIGTAYNGTVGNYNATWTGSANSISITTEEQWRFSEVTIYTGEGGNEGGNEGGDDPVYNGSITLLDATDANAAEGWTLGAENLPEGLSYVWLWKNYNGAYYLAASAYVGGAANEASEYAVSPVIEITADGDASMSFEHAAKFQTTIKELCYVAAREEGATEWTKLTVSTWPEANTWNYANSGDIDLSAFKGKKIEIGLHYGSSNTGADTWQIRNIIVVGGKLAGTSTPDDPTPVEKTTFSKTTSTADLVSGSKYIFAVDNLVSSPINETYNYGRLSLSEGTFVDSKIEAPTANALVFTETENGWTIQDASNRYYSMQGTYTTFQMYTEVAESSYWTIEYNADGTVTILNALNDDYVISRGKGDQSWFNTLALTQLTESAVLGENYALPTLYIEGEVSSIESTIATENAPVEYFNLQGVRVANPENGLFIRRQGNKVSKVVL